MTAGVDKTHCILVCVCCLWEYMTFLFPFNWNATAIDPSLDFESTSQASDAFAASIIAFTMSLPQQVFVCLCNLKLLVDFVSFLSG